MKKTLLVLLAVLLGACSSAPRDGLEIQDLRIRPPLPGSAAAVAYFTIVNHGPTELEIKGVSSDSFAAAEIHRSIIEDGVSRMRHVATLSVPSQGSVAFEPGSYHVMLFRPVEGLAPGQQVSISVAYGDNGDVTASAVYGEGF